MRFLGYAAGRPSKIQIAFYGGNFLGLRDPDVRALLEMAQHFVRKGHVNDIRFSTRPDTIDDHRLKLIVGYSVRAIELGVQSMSDEVLSMNQRGHTSSDTVFAVHKLKKNGYEVGLQMMVGLPGDTIRRSWDTARRIVDLAPDYVRIYPTVVLESSLLAKWYQRGEFTPWALSSCVSLVKELYLLFTQNNIRVIRMGLQAEVGFNSGRIIIAGPYHPAFGHLVHSKMYLDAAIDLVKTYHPKQSPIRIYVHPYSVSKMRGHMNDNTYILESKFKACKVDIIPDPKMVENSIRLEGNEPVCVYDYKLPDINTIITAET
jgi:histone acetyltransferase (RNA polymerase elongator complex component)